MMAKTKTKKGPDYITAQLWPLALPIGDLLEDPSNARLHNEQNINAIKSSLQKFGQRKPVVLNKRSGIVLAGNGTLTAARSLGWEYLATVIVDDDPATATGFAIADNRTAELAEWDDEVLARLLEAVEEEMPAVELGFTDEDLAELLGMDEGPIGDSTLDTSPQLGDVEFRVVVIMNDETDQKSLIERLESEGFTCQALMS
jgi:ParB family chromosome partitioning protein